MGIREEIEKDIGDKNVTRIVGQPSERDATQLRKELGKMAGSVKTKLGGGKHGHLGLVIPEDTYKTISHGSQIFDIPAHPGDYPAQVSTDAATREKEVAEHKANKRTCEKCDAVHEFLKEKAIKAIDEEWLVELDDDILGFANVSLLQILEHLTNQGGKLDYIDISKLKKERDSGWDTNEHIVKHIVKVQKAVDILNDRAKIPTAEGELLNDLLYTIKESGEMEQALVDWDARSEAEKTWKKAKTYFTKKYADRNKHAAIDARNAGFSTSAANQIQEAREEAEENAIAAEILAQLRASESNSMQKLLEQQQAMLESNQKLMLQLMNTVITGSKDKGNTNPRGPGNSNGGGGGGNSKFEPPEWQMTKKGEKIQHDGKTWWWCPNHNEGKGLYVRHKPENHEKWVESKGQRYRYTDKSE